MRKLLIGLVSLLISLAVARMALRKVLARHTTVRVVNTAPQVVQLLNRRVALAEEPPKGEGLERCPLGEREAAVFFPTLSRADHVVYDPLVYIRVTDEVDRPYTEFPEHPDGGFQMRVNNLGLREDYDVETAKRDLRVLFTGDSHTFGLCDNSESFPNLLDGLLAEALPGRDVEVLNGGLGNYSFYNYLGVLERFLHLQPDVFVMVGYGGNDFSAAVALQRYFEVRGPMEIGPHEDWNSRIEDGVGAQETNQLTYFRNNPGDVEQASRAAIEVVDEIARICEEHGIELLIVYLPPPFRGQPELYAKLMSKTLRVLNLEPEALEVSDRMADAWLAGLHRGDVRKVDLRPDFRAAPEPLYWRSDLHLNLAGHRFVAQRLLGEIVPLLAGD